MNSCKTCHLKDSNIYKNHFCICTPVDSIDYSTVSEKFIKGDFGKSKILMQQM